MQLQIFSDHKALSQHAIFQEPSRNIKTICYEVREDKAAVDKNGFSKKISDK